MPVTNLRETHACLWLSDLGHAIDCGTRYDTIVSLYWPGGLPANFPDTGHRFVVDDDFDAGQDTLSVLLAAAQSTVAALQRGERVLVHCTAGENRSAAVVVLVDLLLDGAGGMGGVGDAIGRVRAAKERDFPGRRWPTLSNVGFVRLLSQWDGTRML